MRSIFKQLIPALPNKIFSYDTSPLKLKRLFFFASLSVFDCIVIRQFKMNVRGLNPLSLI